MTRQEFKKLEKKNGIKCALLVFARECDEITRSSVLEQKAKQCINEGDFMQASYICDVLTHWWYGCFRVFSAYDIRVVTSIEDIEDLFEE